ncbi:uncharacterized protein [Aegilops tauschii subsp. strangulata]|uniref:uncharacterized protein isoform X2 n=1 Tax=Aegilops tauschii subsp. strangulata TaxID=200361 RepID=UPI001ABC22B9|nr:uncharacterized protein LOC109732028 isoform X5 [Aegilops tauschii subsp. strangulata]
MSYHQDYVSTIKNFFTELTEVDCVPHPAFNPMDIEGTTLSRQLFVWRKMHGVDGCFIKLSTGQQILAATGRDGNNNIYPIAFGVVDKEDTDSWTWFLTQLKDALGGESGKFGYYTIISDRQKPNRSHASASSTVAAPTRKRPSPCTADVGTAPPRKKAAPAATTPTAPPRRRAAPAAIAPTAPPRRSPRKNATPAPTAPPGRSPRKKTTPAGTSSTSAAGHRGTFHAPRQTGRKRTVSYKMKEYLYAYALLCAVLIQVAPPQNAASLTAVSAAIGAAQAAAAAKLAWNVCPVAASQVIIISSHHTHAT